MSSLVQQIGVHIPTPIRQVTGTAARVVHAFFEHNGTVHAGNMAFLATLSLFPFLVLLVSISGFLGQTESGALAIQTLFDSLPEEVRDTLDRPVQMIVAGAQVHLLTVGGVMALWTASSCVEAARVAVIRAYDGWDHARPIWQRRLQSMGSVLAAVLMALITMSILVVLPVVFSTVDAMVPEEVDQFELVMHAREWLAPLMTARTVLGPLIIFLYLWICYRGFAPRVPNFRRRFWPGALATMIFWLALGKSFSLYLSTFGQYNATYGSMAGVVITQIFLFLLCSGFVLGAELNATLSRRDNTKMKAHPKAAVIDSAP